MSSNIASIVDYVHPTVSGTGIITNDQVWVVFDREIDESTIAGGNFFVTGPDFDTWSGPDLQLFLDRESVGDEEEILQSPGFHGIVQGVTTFERVALDSLTTVSTQDTIGSGGLYRTKAIFTPTNRLQANTEYQVFLSGDEDTSDDYITGISDRTVFDVVTSDTNVGSDDIEVTGGYIGSAASDTYRIAITTSGEVGTARFTFVRDSDPLSVFGPFITKRSGVLLSDGVTASFGDGTFVPSDQWYVIVQERTSFFGNLSWPFETGSGSIQTLPDTTATSVIGDPVTTATSGGSSSSSSFSVSSTSPLDEQSNITLEEGAFEITATFNKAIDNASVVSGVSATVYSESVTGEPSVAASGELIALPSASGSTLTISVAAEQLRQNNLVTVTLDSTLAATDGTSLGSDYQFWFTTQYYPMYCTLRMSRVRIGSFINSLRDDTVNIAIHMASKEADHITWNTLTSDDEYYQFARMQWTCCRTAQILLTNTVGGAGAIKSKKLGDLEVSYNTETSVSKPLQLAEDCLAKWEGTVMAGGRQVQSPSYMVKGELDIDKPPIGRGWIHTRDIHNNQMPIANRRLRLSGYRRYRGVYTRSTYPKGWWVS